jgi:hypothetical protein
LKESALCLPADVVLKNGCVLPDHCDDYCDEAPAYILHCGVKMKHYFKKEKANGVLLQIYECQQCFQEKKLKVFMECSK